VLLSDTRSPVSFLSLHGRYVRGENAEQWRAEGFCEPLPLEEIAEIIPVYSVSNMIASKRFAEGPHAGDERISVESTSHLTEMVQHARQEIESDAISMLELHESIMACRFVPDRVERMSGGPDGILWERWEWKRQDGAWLKPKWLLPH